MKCLISLTVFLTVTLVNSKSTSRRTSEGDIKDYQSDVLKLYQGLGTEDTHDFVRKQFPYNDPSYYTNPKALEKFLYAFENSFLDKEGYFNLYSYKNRHDTYRLFDLFYYAKDFETFYKIAKWAKHELHPLQFVHAFTAAIYHRKDTQGVIPPPFYEVLPQYFTPAYVMTSAYKSMVQKLDYRKFDVNNTGFEWSWYKDHSDRFGPKYDDYDVETRMSYYREDVGINDWYSKFFLQIAPWLSDEKYPEMEWERRGEYLYSTFKWMLNKYNLERYANDLPPVEPMNFWKPIKGGYYSQLANVYGRPFFHRPDGVNPSFTYPYGVHYFKNMYMRYLDDVESNYMHNPVDKSSFSIDGVYGFENFTKIFYGISNPEIRQYYRPIYYQALETVDAAYRASNDVGYSGSTLINFMTEHRDPIFYQILAYIDQLFEVYNAKKTPYTKDQIEFPGVELSSVDFSDLSTYFEKYEYDISNSIPSPDGFKYKYIVSKTRLNHKPFSYKINIKSDKAVDATVKVFFAPKYDSSYRLYGFTGFTKYGMEFDSFHVSLKSGSNTIERKSTDANFKEAPRLKHILEQIQRFRQKGEALHYSDDFLRAFPANLALPRGGRKGTEYQVFAFVFPKGSSSSNSESQDTDYVQEYDHDKYLMYPFDRPVSEYVFDVPNTYFSEISITDESHY